MFSTLISLFAATSLALAFPLAPRTGAWCEGLGITYDTASNFTLAALNTTLANANSTGAPLVAGQNGATDGAEFEVLSTWATYPYLDFPTMSLDSGVLIPNSANGVPSYDMAASAGQPLQFFTTSQSPSGRVAQIYCAIVDTDPDFEGPPTLAVNGDADGFALCMNGDGPYAQNNVVWRPTADNNGAYLYETCYNVTLQIVGGSA
ncbi:uncharacterized protein B0H18DRAFT_1124179 [Fomitopsis serialis]|uniref:uncharacterized protein n=1 Tax=Fomitopsis serialis TaxID=139415 RepID=UPI0020089175|nr:uncharacterized protein B0H18DRAFT_1124179 [Neoantrodia serialis]KAH9916542.1 hypothetical protein B0H18DRAFT_1124179 [Neoantrodia serialis]